jgi:hypothetical protein
MSCPGCARTEVVSKTAEGNFRRDMGCIGGAYGMQPNLGLGLRQSMFSTPTGQVFQIEWGLDQAHRVCTVRTSFFSQSAVHVLRNMIVHVPLILSVSSIMYCTHLTSSLPSSTHQNDPISAVSSHLSRYSPHTDCLSGASWELLSGRGQNVRGRCDVLKRVRSWYFECL